MNLAHIHLLTNHMPLFGSILGGLVLAYGIWTKSSHVKIAAYNLFILSAIGAIIAYLTGESAEESVENIQGISKNLIDAHEDFSMVSLVSFIILGVASLAGLVLTLSKSKLTGSMSIIVLFISLTSFGLVGWTAYLGGQIRHSEITNTEMSPQGQSESDDDE